MYTEEKVLTRERLYEEVWTSPMIHVARKHGHTDVGLGKYCRRLKIPLPGRGYWAKKAAGKRVGRRPRLPTLERERINLPTIREPRPEKEVKMHEPRRELDPDVKALLDREESAERIVVSDDLRWAHKLVRGVLKDQKRERRNSRCPRFVERQERIWELADISVGPELFGRALRIMNALMKALQSRGFEVKGDSERFAPLSQVTILGQTFKLRMIEPNKQVPHVLTHEEKAWKRKGILSWVSKIDKIASGELVLQAISATYGFTSRFRDGKKCRLEEQLNSVVKAMLRLVDAIRVQDKENERRRQGYEEVQRQRLAEEERRRQIEEERKREQERVNRLLEEVAAWRRSRDLRQYLETIRQRVLLRGEAVTPESEIGAWLLWARDVADRLEPIRFAVSETKESGAGTDGRTAGEVSYLSREAAQDH